MAASSDLSSSVERWRRRYLSREGYLLDVTQAKSKSRRALIAAGDNSLDDTVESILINSSQSKLLYCRGKHNKRFLDSSKTLKNLAWPDDELDSLYDSNQLHIQPEPIEDFLGNGEIQSEGIYSETDITLPSTLRVAAYCDYNNDGDAVRDSVSISGTQELNGESMVTPQFNQIYHELSIIHQKLQQEKLSQQEYALKLQKRECFIAEREVQLYRHEAALTKIKGVEEEVHTKFQIMKELSNVTEQNKKLEVQSQKVQARLENLQRKHEFLSVQRSKEPTFQDRKPVKSERAIASAKAYKLPLNSHVYNLLTVLMDWISEQHLCKLIVEEEKENIHKLTGTLASSINYTQEKCVKLLPLVAEQLRWLPFVNPNLHFPVVKCIYWAVRQLDGSTQHTAMTSTMRRLGEDLFKGVVPKENQHNSSEHATDSKPKAASFFKSCSLSLRVVSTLIIIKVVTQADYLAQAFDSLCIDLKTEEGKVLFLDYQAVPIILTHLRMSRKGLLSNAIDSLLQMTTESRYLNRFLEACSNELFFRTCSVLLRSFNLDIQLLEKLSILLQKLSKIKSNKKMFELFTLHLMIQELLRTAHPDHTFLCINLNSILFNLGLIKNNPIESSQNASD
ncbi:coiled-coil domain-containing protein 138 isoform X3 [Crotalus tigris]|uniref:coiled-coil domain-containing protein 138 isoform X3 n=1 Tax=Crotalus tigris TaxID=88082 RepID=UPI00192F6C33|nr:coiled-coil domain-containing protein 138 isoform X3 [Crotalus tigris]